MHPADKSVLRLAFGLGLAALIAYGMALPIPYLVCLLSVLLLAKPGPPLPLGKGLALAALLGGMVALGVLMVPLLENYKVAGVILTGAVLFALFFTGQRTGNPLVTVLIIAFTVVPVAGVADQALVTIIAGTLALGVAVGALVGGVAHAFCPDAPAAGGRAPAVRPGRAAAAWIAARGTLVVLPVFVLVLSDPSAFMPALLNTANLAQQACGASARSAGRQLVGSTLLAAALAAVVWCGLSLLPSLWMLALWLMLAAVWVGARLYRAAPTALPATFWSGALTTMLILLGPAIEDSANGEGVLGASVGRIAIFIGVALYAWATVWLSERWRAGRDVALAGNGV